MREKAHKLINELTVISGWLEMMGEEIQLCPMPHKCRGVQEATLATSRAIGHARTLRVLLSEEIASAASA